MGEFHTGHQPEGEGDCGYLVMYDHAYSGEG